MKPTRFLITLTLLAGLVLTGCTTASPPTTAPTPLAASDDLSLGHWEVVRRIDYDALPKTRLKGDLGPAYLLFLVTLAGFHTDTFGITVGPDDDARYTTDSGQSWTKATSALHCRHGLEIVDEKIAWHCGNGGTRVSTNGGQTWRTVAPSACPYLSFLDARTGWSASPYDLQATSDGGASWQPITLPANAQSLAAIALRTANDGYVLDTAGNLFVTTDGGRSWQTHALGLNADEHLIATTVGPKTALRFFDAQHGLVVFDLADKTVWFAQTADGGRSWRRAEIAELRDQAAYYHLYLARDGQRLTVTDAFNGGASASLVLRYRHP
jgi:photosystem II stability/assembly factor-like uncharacterized protein